MNLKTDEKLSQTATPSAIRTEWSERMRLVKWAKKNGAVQVKIDGVEILFPPPMEPGMDMAQPAVSPGPSSPTVAPGLQSLRAMVSEAPSRSQPMAAINSEQDHPDVFARDLDAWANQTRLPRKGP